jgi:hypothetical protein
MNNRSNRQAPLKISTLKPFGSKMGSKRVLGKMLMPRFFLETFAERSILFKVIEDRDFNHRTALSILRIKV